MKRLILILTAVMVSVAVANQATAQTRAEMRQMKKMARDAKYVAQMDSIIMNGNYTFMPQSVNVDPGGSTITLQSVNNYVTVNNEAGWVDINLPFVRQKGPVVNFRANVDNFKAVQTSSGWVVTFSSNLNTTGNYSFVMNIHSVRNDAVLTITSESFNTVTYTGYIKGRQ